MTVVRRVVLGVTESLIWPLRHILLKRVQMGAGMSSAGCPVQPRVPL